MLINVPILLVDNLNLRFEAAFETHIRIASITYRVLKF